MEVAPLLRGEFAFVARVVDGYTISDTSPPFPAGAAGAPPFVVENPGSVVGRYPLASPTLHLDFVKLGEAKDFAKAVCAFAARWGLLGDRFALFGIGPHGRPARGESLATWQTAVKEVAPAAHLLRRLERGENLELTREVTVHPPLARATIGERHLTAMLGSATVRHLQGASPIERARVGALALVLAAVNRGLEGRSRVAVTMNGVRGAPTCLLGAIWLRLGMTAFGIRPADGVSACPRCGKLLEARGRRVYCSSRCRKLMWETRATRWRRRR